MTRLKPRILKESSELRLGIAVESEHKNTYAWIKAYYDRYQKFPPEQEVYRHIASDHLKEDPQYYTKLKKMESNQ